LRIKKTFIPILSGLRGTYFVAENIEISPELADAFNIGYKIKSIEFDDLSFDTEEPELPLWFRIREWWRS